MNRKRNRRSLSQFSQTGLYQILSLILMTVHWGFGMQPPPNYSQSNMPDTNFTCDDKATGGYYADPEAECQMFHVCVRISDKEMNDFRFLCPNDTVFDQQNFICTNWWETHCEKSTQYYNKNDLFKVDTQKTSEPEYQDSSAPVYYEYTYEYGENQRNTKQNSKNTRNLNENSKNSNVNINNNANSRDGKNVNNRQNLNSGDNFKVIEILNTPKPSLRLSRAFSTSTSRPFANSFKVAKNIVSNRPSKFLQFEKPNEHVEVTVPPQFHFLSATHPPPVSLAKGFSKSDQVLKSADPTHRESKNLDVRIDNENEKDLPRFTSSSRTRYETLYGKRSSRGRKLTRPHIEHIQRIREIRRNDSLKAKLAQKELISRPFNENKNFEESSFSHSRRENKNLAKISTAESSTSRRVPDSKHRQFAKFRFYKTAFGRSYSSDDLLGNTGTTSAPFQFKSNFRPERTASRNTRYSVFG